MHVNVDTINLKVDPVKCKSLHQSKYRLAVEPTEGQ